MFLAVLWDQAGLVPGLRGSSSAANYWPGTQSLDAGGGEAEGFGADAGRGAGVFVRSLGSGLPAATSDSALTWANRS